MVGLTLPAVLTGLVGVPETSARRRECRIVHHTVEHQLGETGVRIGDEVPVEVGRDERHVEDVRVGQLDAEHVARLRLDRVPIGLHAPCGPVIRRPVITGPCGTEVVVTQEDLVRRVRRVGLALVDERCRLVGRLAVDVRRPGEDHERRGARRQWLQRVVGVERHEDAARASLVDQVETVVEELAEQSEPRVVRRGQPGVGRHVGDEVRTVHELDIVREH